MNTKYKTKKDTPLWLTLILIFVLLYGFVQIILPTGLYHLRNYLIQNQQPAGLTNGIVIQSGPATIISTTVPKQAHPASIEIVPVATVVIPTQQTALNVTEEEKAFWADCAFKQGRGQRVSPRCPSNARELLGSGR